MFCKIDISMDTTTRVRIDRHTTRHNSGFLLNLQDSFSSSHRRSIRIELSSDPSSYCGKKCKLVLSFFLLLSLWSHCYLIVFFLLLLLHLLLFYLFLCPPSYLSFPPLPPPPFTTPSLCPHPPISFPFPLFPLATKRTSSSSSISLLFYLSSTSTSSVSTFPFCY